MKKFFFCTNLTDIQKSFYQGKVKYIQFIIIDSTCYESIKKTIKEMKSINISSIGDMYTADVYQEHIKNSKLGNINQLSYSMCTDGVKYKFKVNFSIN